MTTQTDKLTRPKGLPKVLTSQQQEAVIYTAIGVWIAFNKHSPQHEQRDLLMWQLREHGQLTLPDQQVSMLAENAIREWCQILDLPPWM